MQLPSIDRQPGLRPSGAGPVPSSGSRVVPVAPVNPPAPSQPLGVVSRISDSAVAANSSEAIFRSVPDPVQRGAQSERATNDWTIKRPQPQKVEEPPPEPISKRLLEFLRSMWRASGSVVELSQGEAQALSRSLNAPLNQNNPNATPGVLAKEALTYTPGKIKKNEKL